MSTESATSRAKARPEPSRETQPGTASHETWVPLPDLFNQLTDAVLVTDLTGRITGCNQRVSRYGFLPETLMGENIEILCRKDQQAFFRDVGIPAAVKLGRFEGELHGRTKTGTELCVHVCLYRLQHAESTPAGLLAIFIDTTDRTLADIQPARVPNNDKIKPSAGAPSPRSIDDTKFVVESPLMHRFMGLVERVAGHTETVLIVGETGTGKELVARTIHNASHRSARQLVDINCAALPEQLVESELFGYEKGAFSGADASKPGLFELADKSTIFLDEIGELEPQVQVKLLRVLDGSAYFRLGGHRKIVVDVRVVAATNQDLEVAVKEGRFRKDLYHRLSQFLLRVPPLRERPEDVLALAQYFLALKTHEKTFSAEALAQLQTQEWPGNVRELRNLVAKLAITSSTPEISLKDVLRELSTVSPVSTSMALPADLEGMEEQMIVRALESTGGHRAQAAEKLGISRRTLSRKLREYRIDTPTSGKTLGTISQDQQKFFRTKVDLPVTLRNAAGDQCFAKAQNLSTGGMGLEDVQEPERFAGLLEVSFTLPESDDVMNGKVRLVWADAAGRAGARFVAIDPTQFQKLQRWANRQMEREGWELPS